jgi:DNA-binding protein HU-beta
VNKAELIDALAVKINGSKKQAAEAVEAVFDAIQHAVAAGEKVAITGFGVFEKADRAARTARNPRTGATVKVKATSVPKFRAGSEFKAVVAGKRKAAAKKAVAKKAPAKKAPVRKAAPAKKVVAKKAPVRKAVAKKAPVRKAVAKKAPAKKAPVRKAVAKKAPAKKAAARR